MRIRKESLSQKLDLSAFENIFTDPLTFNVKDSHFSGQEVVTNLISHYGALSGGNYCVFEQGHWGQGSVSTISDKSHLSEGLSDLSVQSAIECGAYSLMTLEGDTLVNGDSLSLSLRKPVARIEDEITEITHTTHAFYDLEMSIFTKDKTKVFTCLNEVEISLSGDDYKVQVTNKNKKRLNQDKLDRYSSLDMMDKPPIPRGKHLPDDKRFDDLDIPQRKKRVPKPKDGYMMNPADLKGNDPTIANRIKNLDMNRYSRKNEEELRLIQQQDISTDTVLGQNLAKTATQKLGKQNIATQQQVAPSIQKQADKMSYAQAYEYVNDVNKAWEDADPYKQFSDTIKLVDQWYKQDSATLINDSLMGAFKYIDDLYKASELARKISKLEDDISKTKSRSELTKLKKELVQVRKEFDDTMGIITAGRGKISQGKEILDASATKLEASLEEYLDDYMSNNALWKTVKGKMEKMSKQVEMMEALKNKYASNLDLPPLLYRYKDLMATPTPSIIDIESLKINDVDILYKAWYADMMQYRKTLESFNDSFQANYDALARILGVKAKTRSLF